MYILREKNTHHRRRCFAQSLNYIVAEFPISYFVLIYSAEYLIFFLSAYFYLHIFFFLRSNDLSASISLETTEKKC